MNYYTFFAKCPKCGAVAQAADAAPDETGWLEVELEPSCEHLGIVVRRVAVREVEVALSE